MSYRSIVLVLSILCVSQTVFGQIARPGILPTLRPAIKDDGRDDFTVGDVKGSVKTNAVFLPKPLYPEDARQAGVEGLVSVRIKVDNEGNVIAAEAESGEQLLRRSSEEAARRSKFRIARDAAGQPMDADGVLIYTFEIKPAGWARIGLGLSSIQKFSISRISIPMIRKAMDPQWTSERELLDRLEAMREAEPPDAGRPVMIRGPVVNSGRIGSPVRGSASQTISGSITLPLSPTTEQLVVSQELINALRERLRSDPLKTWQFDLGTSLFGAFDLYRDPTQRDAAADTVLRFIQSKPDAVSDEVLTALRTIESKFRNGNRTIQSENAIADAMKAILRAR